MKQTMNLMILVRVVWESVEAGSRETTTKPLKKSGNQGRTAWIGWEGHSEERDSLNFGGGKKSPGNFNGVCVAGGRGSLAPLEKKQFSQKAWAELPE